MSLKDWLDNGWLVRHKTSRDEIRNLFLIVDRDLADATRNISPDWKFGIAYNASLKLCTILMNASGYRPERALAHYRTLQALPLILGKQRQDDASYLDSCRTKRNSVEYDCVGGATDAEAKELVEFGKSLRKDVVEWLSKHHPTLAP